MSEQTFGQTLLSCRTAREAIALETTSLKASPFDAIASVLDGLLGDVFQRAAPLITIERLALTDRVHLPSLSPAARRTLTAHLGFDVQRARGAWFLPETVSLVPGRVNFPAHFRAQARFAHSLAHEERASVELASTLDALVVWSLLEPFLTDLLRPIELNGPLVVLAPEKDADAWQRTDELYAWLELPLAEVSPLHPPRGARSLGAQALLETKGRLLAMLAGVCRPGMARLLATWHRRDLVSRYYQKAKKGTARRKDVLTKALAPVLAGLFGGDWPAFVHFLGEPVHEAETLVTTVPEPRLVLPQQSRAVELAAKKGIPVEEVERMLGAFWGEGTQDSPVHERLEVLRSYWSWIDALHARQAPGMVPLWGLVDEGLWPGSDNGDGLFQPELFRRLLPEDLIEAIERLWGTTVLEKWPDRRVSEPLPHARLAGVLGPALRFWHGCGLTTWFLCEGPSSRTDLPGLADYYQRELAELKALGCGVDPSLFQDLRAVGRRLGPEEARYEHPVGPEGGVSVRVAHGSRRAGFVLLRDIVTQHRRAWTATHLDPYLRARWEPPLKTAATAYHLAREERGKPPTLKQFAKQVVGPAADWFGGDVGQVYTVLGEKVSFDVTRRLTLPCEARAFVTRVATQLGHELGVPLSGYALAHGTDPRERHVWRVAQEAIVVVQVEEATGALGTIKGSEPRLQWPAQSLALTTEVLFAALLAAIQRVRLDLATHR